MMQATVTLSDETFDALQAEAKRQGVTTSDLLAIGASFAVKYPRLVQTTHGWHVDPVTKAVTKVEEPAQATARATRTPPNPPAPT